MKILKTILLILLLLLPVFVLGQGQVQTGLEILQAYLIGIVKVLFVIIMVLGMIRTIAAFVSGNPNAPKFLLYLIIALAIWLLFPLLLGDSPIGIGIDNL